MPRPPLYDILYDNFVDGLGLNTVSETDWIILSVLDNMQRILNCQAGTLVHPPDYDLPDMTAILQRMPASAHQLMSTLSAVLLKYKLRPQWTAVVILDQYVSGELRYAIDVESKDTDPAHYGTELMSEGKVLIRHLKRQQYLGARSAL